MTEQGGPTTQSGILYQNSVAALYLGRLIDATDRPKNQLVLQVRTEAPEHVDDIVITFADGHKKYVQAKESLASSGRVWEKLWQSLEKQFLEQSFQMGEDRISLHIGELQERHNQLDELCQRAYSSDDYTEWKERLTEKQQALLQKIESSVTPDFVNPDLILNFMRHIDVEIWPLSYIERDLVPVWIPNSNKSASELFRLLRDRVAGESKIRGSITANELRTSLSLEDPDLQFVDPSDTESLRSSIQNTGSILRLHKSTIAGTDYHIKRSVVNDIVNWINESRDDQKNVAMLIDHAGMGKTVVLQDVLNELQGQGMVVLSMKADQQLSELTSISDIQGRLGLSHSVEKSIDRMAKLGRVAILVDQIDALSLTLAHDQRTLNVVLDLVARLRLIPNVRIVISCRLFDRNSDPRLKQIGVDQQFRVTELSESEIKVVLTQVDVDYDSLAMPTKDLLRVPLHLDLFVYAVENEAETTQLFLGAASLQELYGLIWENVVLKQDPTGPPNSDRIDALYLLIDYMDRRQTMSAPLSLFQQHESDGLEVAANWLASTGILVRARTGWTLLHQTFFDYCYARRFVEQGKNIVDTLLTSEQGLHERAKLIQVISFLRGSEVDLYLRTLNQLLVNSNLRYHLKDLLIRWLGSLPDPGDNEWIIVRRLLAEDTERINLTMAMYGNTAWFPKMREAVLAGWLEDKDLVDSIAIPYLASMIDTAQSEVVSIISPYLGRSEIWDDRIFTILSRIRAWKTVEAIELFERHFRRYPFVNSLNLYRLEALAQANPIAGCRLIRLILDQILDNYLEKRTRQLADLGESYAYSFSVATLYMELSTLDNTQLSNIINSISRVEPKLFVELLLPWLMRVLSNHDEADNGQYSFAWDDLSSNWYENTFRTRNAIIKGLIHALVEIAESEPQYFEQVSAQLDTLPFITPQRLLANVYRIIPRLCSDKAYDFLLADQRRLKLGREQYDSRQLIKEIFPFLSAEQRLEIEEKILSYAPILKSRGLEGLRWRGIGQLYLLQAIPIKFLSSTGLQKLREWERKFPGIQAPETPVTGGGGGVGSPILEEIAKKMSDKNWLGAMQKYQGGVEHKDLSKGGARELAAVMGTLVQENPIRFFYLFDHVPDDVDDTYVRSFIEGLADSDAPSELLFDTVGRFAPQENRNIRESVARVLEKRASDNDVPDNLVELLHGWLNDPPGEDEWWWSEGDDHGSAYESYINSDRGTAFQTLMRIYDYRNTEEAHLAKWSLVEYAAKDESTALRIGAIHELTYMIRFDDKRAIFLFERLIDGHDVLLESRTVRQFIYYSYYKNYLLLHPHIVSLMEHDKDDVKEQGAQLACIAALSTGAMECNEAGVLAQYLAARTLDGPPAWRRGVARICVHNIRGNTIEVCEQAIIALLDDNDEQVLQHINSIFHFIDDNHFFVLRNFFEAYASSVKELDYAFSEYFWKHGLLDPTWTLLVVQTYIEHIQKREQHQWRSGIEELIRLVLRIYTDPTANVALRNDAMDIFDLLMEGYSSQAQKVLNEWDLR